MPGCNLSATGVNFDVDAFLNGSTWRNLASVFHKGEPTGISSRPFKPRSGLRIDISDEEESLLEPQLQAVMKFLDEHSGEIERLVAFPGIDELEIKIGLFWHHDTVCYPLTLPPEFLMVSGKVGIPITLYIYAVSSGS